MRNLLCKRATCDQQLDVGCRRRGDGKGDRARQAGCGRSLLLSVSPSSTDPDPSTLCQLCPTPCDTVTGILSCVLGYELDWDKMLRYAGENNLRPDLPTLDDEARLFHASLLNIQKKTGYFVRHDTLHSRRRHRPCLHASHEECSQPASLRGHAQEGRVARTV
jgi:hypothetical protein